MAKVGSQLVYLLVDASVSRRANDVHVIFLPVVAAGFLPPKQVAAASRPAAVCLTFDLVTLAVLGTEWRKRRCGGGGCCGGGGRALLRGGRGGRRGRLGTGRRRLVAVAAAGAVGSRPAERPRNTAEQTAVCLVRTAVCLVVVDLQVRVGVATRERTARLGAAGAVSQSNAVLRRQRSDIPPRARSRRAEV